MCLITITCVLTLVFIRSPHAAHSGVVYLTGTDTFHVILEYINILSFVSSHSSAVDEMPADPQGDSDDAYFDSEWYESHSLLMITQYGF